MATSTGNDVTGSYISWHSYVTVSEVSRTDTTITFRVQGGYDAKWAMNVYANGSTSAGGSWSGSVVTSNRGSYGQAKQVMSNDVTVSRTGSDRTVSYSCTINVTGGYGNGTSTASVSVSVPHRQWYAPHAPGDFAVERVSDASQKLTWTGNYTSYEGGYPWTGVYVDRATDDGDFETIKTLNWDAVNYTDSTTETGHKYTYRARSYNPTGSTATASIGVFTTPAAIGGVTASKPTSGSVSLALTGVPKYYDSLEFQATSDGGTTWQAVSATASGTDAYTDNSPLAGTVTYRARAVKDGLYGAWASSNQVVTICAPNAPSLGRLSAAYATGTGIEVTWTPNHPDGTAQSAAQVEVTPPSGTAATYSVTTATSYALTLSTKGAWKVRVRTKGLHADWGAWSSYVAFTVADAPQAHFSSPSIDGTEIDKLPLSVAWSVTDSTGVSSQKLELLGPDGAAVSTVTLAGSARTYSYGSAAGFANSTTYTLRLTVYAGSGLSLAVTRTFNIEWAQPAPPAVAVSFDDAMAGTVIVADGGGDVAAVGFDVARVDAYGTTAVASGLTAGQQAIDPLPPLNTEFKYRVTAYAASGAVTVEDVAATAESDAVMFNFGAAAQVTVRGLYDPDWSKEATHSVKTMHFMDGGAGDSLPMAYALNEDDVAESYSFAMPKEDYLAAYAASKAYRTGWVRDLYGDVSRAVISMSFSRAACDWWSASIKCERVRWEEPNAV